MYKSYLRSVALPGEAEEASFILAEKRTCFNGMYPFKLFPARGLSEMTFGPVTLLYGGNGSGKSTLLNVLAEKLGVIRHSAFSGGAFFAEYVSRCSVEAENVPKHSQILTSDDVFDYMLNIRYLNDGIDVRREELFEDYLDRKFAEHRLRSLEEYDDWKESYDAKTMTQSRFVRERLMRNVDMFSNGESAMKYFTDRITENALYLLDEPENSLAIGLQKELSRYIDASARYYGCQFVIATHSPILLSIPDAVIYDLDTRPVRPRRWTQLENVRAYYEFFREHSAEFESEVAGDPGLSAGES